ncbi:MAG TPA: class I SAM-dependent methyltransferase [Acidimicrobiales bacterium]|nr:class I SAM-dependent methyltransferase [Acidimicrobiales bacterium]
MAGEGEAHDAVRRSYDAVAQTYYDRLRDELNGKPLDRALLRLLAEDAGAGASVADVGCGPGHVAAWLAGLGQGAVGIDLSPSMVELGCARYPAVEFRVGDILDLPAADGEFAAAVALYVLIHLAPDELSRAAGELWRVLRPGGLLLVAFHAGDEVRHLDDWWEHEVDLDFRFLSLSDVADVLRDAGFVIEASLERRPYVGEADTRRGYVLARRPSFS